MGVGVPVAMAVNVTLEVEPTVTVWLIGWTMTTGGATVTVTAALFVVAEDTELVNTA